MPKAAVDATQTIAEIVRMHEETRSVFLRHGLALGENAVILAAEVVGYRRHGSVEKPATPL